MFSLSPVKKGATPFKCQTTGGNEEEKGYSDRGFFSEVVVNSRENFTSTQSALYVELRNFLTEGVSGLIERGFCNFDDIVSAFDGTIYASELNNSDKKVVLKRLYEDIDSGAISFEGSKKLKDLILDSIRINLNVIDGKTTRFFNTNTNTNTKKDTKSIFLGYEPLLRFPRSIFVTIKNKDL